jgi:SAM-dependent methyltransferase
LNRAGIEGSCGAKLCSGESTKEGLQPGGFDDGDMEAVLKEPEVNRDVWGPAALEQRRERTRQHLASIVARRESWIKRNRYYYELLSRLLRFLVEPEKNVLSVRCGTGNLLNAVRPRNGKGVDICAEIVEIAQQRNPSFNFAVAFPDKDEFRKLFSQDDKFDYILFNDIGDNADSASLGARRAEGCAGCGRPDVRSRPLTKRKYR